MNPPSSPSEKLPDEPLSAEPADPSTAKASYQSEELFGDRKEILIFHNAETYRLRRTRHDKLILYK